jgi:hypothetical protein
MIVPMLLVRYNLKVRINQRLLPGSPKGTPVVEERLPLKVANMDFNFCVMIELLKTEVCGKFWKASYFLDNVVIYIFLDMI